MPVVYPHRQSRLPTIAVAALLIALGGIAFLVVAGGRREPERTREASVEPVSRSIPAVPVAAASASVPVPSQGPAAVRVASSADRSVHQWQAAVQPAVVTAIRDDSLAAYQVQMERWSCEGQVCVGNVRIPPTVDAGRRGDLSAAANVFDKLKTEMAKSDVDVAIQSIQPGPQGLAAAFQFTPNASTASHTYTDAEVATMRLETYQQARKEHDQPQPH